MSATPTILLSMLTLSLTLCGRPGAGHALSGCMASDDAMRPLACLTPTCEPLTSCELLRLRRSDLSGPTKRSLTSQQLPERVPRSPGTKVVHANVVLCTAIALSGWRGNFPRYGYDCTVSEPVQNSHRRGPSIPRPAGGVQGHAAKAKPSRPGRACQSIRGGTQRDAERRCRCPNPPQGQRHHVAAPPVDAHLLGGRRLAGMQSKVFPASGVLYADDTRLVGAA